MFGSLFQHDLCRGKSKELSPSKTPWKRWDMRLKHPPTHTHLWGRTQIVIFFFLRKLPLPMSFPSTWTFVTSCSEGKNKVIPNNLLIHTLSPWKHSFYHFGLTEAFNRGRPEKEVAQQGFKEASCCSSEANDN